MMDAGFRFHGGRIRCWARCTTTRSHAAVVLVGDLGRGEKNAILSTSWTHSYTVLLQFSIYNTPTARQSHGTHTHTLIHARTYKPTHAHTHPLTKINKILVLNTGTRADRKAPWHTCCTRRMSFRWQP